MNHDILLCLIGETIRDNRGLRLIGKYLRRGALIEAVVVRSEEGTPQGGPLSPLLAAIRYWIETHPRLQGNAANSGTGRPW